MTTWRFRMRGQPSISGGFASADYNAQEVRPGVASGRPLVELYRTDYPAPTRTFELDAIFAYHNTGSVIRVWPRDPSSGGESYLATDFTANFAERGTLGLIETIDLIQSKTDKEPLGRVFAKWVSDFGPIPS